MIFLFPSWDMLVFVEGSNKYHYQLHGSLSRMAASKAVKLATKYDKGVIHVTCLVKKWMNNEGLRIGLRSQDDI